MSDLYQVFNENKQRKSELYAALDLGSNSFHLVVARVVADAVQVITKVKHKVRLAEGLDERNHLSQEAISRGVGVLESMRESLQGVDASAIRIVATHTLRKAKNSQAFLSQAKKVFPYKIEIISGHEEARLIFVGIGINLAYQGQRLIFDIGGGSTEFAIGSNTEPNITKSIQVGCVTYQKRFFSDGEISKEATRRAVTTAKVELGLAAGNLKKHTWNKAIASSGSAKAICTVINTLKGRPVDTAIQYQELIDLLSQCNSLGHADALDFEGLSCDRKPVFAAGLCIMIGIFQSLNIDNFQYSDAALREGVLFELQPSHSSQNVRVRTAQSLATRYDVDVNYAHKVLSTSMRIYEKLKDIWQIEDNNLRHLLGWSALLHEVGLQIHSRGLQKHSSYILLNSELPGFNQEQQQIIGFLVRFHRKKLRAEDLIGDTPISQERLTCLLVILRISILLNANRHNSDLPEFQLEVEDKHIKLGFAQEWFELSPLLLADISQEDAYLRNIDFHLSLL